MIPHEASKKNGFMTQDNWFLKLAAIHMWSSTSVNFYSIFNNNTPTKASVKKKYVKKDEKWGKSVIPWVTRFSQASEQYSGILALHLKDFIHPIARGHTLCLDLP